MKTSLVKMILPVAAFVLASAGAVATKTAGSNSKVIDTNGWARLSEGSPCQYVRSCNNNSLMVCKQGSIQVFAKTGVDDCSSTLYHSGS